MSSYKSKFHKSLVCTFAEISISSKKNDLRSTTNENALKGTKAKDDVRCIDKSGKKRLRSRKSRKCTVSILAGCGCQSGRGIVLDRISADSHMPEVLSFQSIPSCSSSVESKVEKCPEWISSASFDEMLKSSSSSSTYHDRQEVHYIHESFIEKKPKELHISPVKFNDLVNKLRRSEQISTAIVPSADADQKFDGKFSVSPNSSSLRRPQRQNKNESSATLANKLVQCKVEESLIPKRKDGMADSLLIMKSSCDPQREFRESMMEMIVENNIKDGKDMEELLACFLYLNSEDYHDVIIQVFKQLWAVLIQV